MLRKLNVLSGPADPEARDLCMQYEQHMSASVLPPLSWQGLVPGVTHWRKIVRLILLMRAHSPRLRCIALRQVSKAAKQAQMYGL